jgi:choice-of-anchor A domain-containing protein
LSSAGLNAISTYGLIVLGNLTTSSDVNLNTIVCDSLINPTSATFGGALNSQNYPADFFSLEINRQIYAPNGINVDLGSVAFGCSPPHSIQNGGSGKYIVNGYTINLNDGRSGAIVEENCTLANTCANITNDVLTLSQELANLPVDSVHNVFISQPNQIEFNVNAVDCHGIAVFNLSASAVFGSTNANIQINNNTAGINLVVINLYGESVTLLSSVNMNCPWLNSDYGRARTIWNLYQAVQLELDNNVQGCLLAPKAAVSTNEVIYGVVVVESFSTQSEVELPYIVVPPGLTECE